MYRVLPEGGARHTSALNFTCAKEEGMIGHCQVMQHHLSVLSPLWLYVVEAPSRYTWTRLVHVGHPPQTGDRLSLVLSPSICCTGGAESLAADLRFQYYYQVTLLSAVFN